MASTMKALHLNRPKAGEAPTLSLETLPIPTLQPNHLLIKVHASAIQPSDILNSKGSFPFTTFPRVPGRDFSGVVVDGPSSRIGEEVYGTSGFTQAFTVDGAHAEYILVTEDAVAPKPKNLSFAQAAVIPVPFTTASLALRRAAAKKEDTVLVLGATGAVGSAVVQIARGIGSRVLLATRKDDGDVNTAKDPELKALDAVTAGKGVDVVVDTVGQPDLTRAAVTKLARGGRLAFITAPRSGSTELGVEMLDFYRNEKSLVGVNTLKYPVEEFAEELKELTPKFEAGILKAGPVNEWTEVKLEDAVDAYAKAGQRGGGKFVVVMR
jgi:NADPH:quinone reductase-like Zn-dependent oxidoreductase